MKMNPSLQVLSLVFYMAFFYLFWIDRTRPYALGLAALFLAVSYFIKALRPGIELVLIVGLTHVLLWSFKFYPMLRWPLDFFSVAGLGYVLIRFLFKNSMPLNWSFKLTRKQWISIALINIPSIIVLIFYFYANQDLAQKWPLPAMPIWAIPFAVIAAAAVNGLREEIFFRGLLQTFSSRTFSTWFVIAFQAISFGSIHFVGSFPRGWMGVGLTALWGGLIALQYAYFRSITLAWLTHAIADAVMFAIILSVR